MINRERELWGERERSSAKIPRAKALVRFSRWGKDAVQTTNPHRSQTEEFVT